MGIKNMKTSFIFKRITSLCILLTLFLGFSRLAAADVNKIIKNVQNTYDDMDNLTASFVQVEIFKLTGTQTETVGKIYIKGGKKYRFESDDQIVVTDGKSVWTYNNISKQLLIDYVRENSGALLPRDMLFKYPKNHYASLLREESDGTKKVYVVRLDPKEDTSGFLSSVKLWIQDKTWLVQKIEAVDLNGNSSLYKINDIDDQTKLPDKLFTYSAPADADVVDMRK